MCSLLDKKFKAKLNIQHNIKNTTKIEYNAYKTSLIVVASLCPVLAVIVNRFINFQKRRKLIICQTISEK